MSPAASQTMALTPIFSASTPTNSCLSSSPTTSFSSISTSMSNSTSKYSTSLPPPPSPSSLSSYTHTSPSDPSTTSTYLATTSSAHPISSVITTSSDRPTSPSDSVTTQISITTSATVAFVTISTNGMPFTTVESIVTTFLSSNALGGNAVTQTSVIINPTLSPSTDSENGSHSLTKGAITAISVTMSLLALSMAVWVFVICRRHREKRKLERDSTTAAMAAAGIIRAPTLYDADDDDIPSMIRQPQALFEDGTPVTSAVDQDFGRPFNPYLYYPEPLILGSGGVDSPVPSPSQMRRSPSVPSPISRVCRERIHTSLSQGHESYEGHEPLWMSGSSRSHSSNAHPLLNGSFQRRDLPKQTSSEDSYAPPMPPPHILTSFMPQYTSVQWGSQIQHDSPISDYTPHGDEEAQALSPLDLHLVERLREGDESRGSVGLRDNEDYSPRPKLEIRNKAGSERTFDSGTSKN